MAFLDVPYNVRVRSIGGRGRVKHAEFAFASGEMTPPEYVEFLGDALGNASRVSRDGAVHFVCCPQTALLADHRARLPASVDLVARIRRVLFEVNVQLRLAARD